MRKHLIGGIGGFLIGVFAISLIGWKAAPEMMLMEDTSKYESFDQTVAEFKKSVKAKGWKIPKVHDMQKTMKKFGVEVKAIQVFELCHPDHAAKILKEGNERIVSSLMPCRVAIYEKPDGKVYLSRMNSGLMAQMMGGLIEEVMDVASRENEEIVSAVIAK